MKKILIVAFILVASTVSAQVKEKLISRQLSDVQLITDNLLSTTFNKYALIQDTTTKRGIEKKYQSEDKVLRISFKVGKEGENYDLGKEGSSYYQLGHISGYYRDLFTFWKNNFQPDADLEKVQAAGHGEVQQIQTEKGKLVLAFAKSGNLWQIIVNNY